MARRGWTLALIFSICWSSLVQFVSAYEVAISDKDPEREVCSGMWAGDHTYINVTFDKNSAGRLAMVIYEFSDIRSLGQVSNPNDDYPLTYVCTTDAMKAGLCNISQLGLFIVNVPKAQNMNETSVWTGSIGFGPNSTLPEPSSSSNQTSGASLSTSGGFWDNPEGNPILPEDANGPTNWKRDAPHLPPQWNYTSVYNWEPIHYEVTRKGYYCVGTVPITVVQGGSNANATHAAFSGTVFFKNAFKGKLAASDYPKIKFYLIMTAVYLLIAGWWGYLCYRYKEDIIPMQFYVAALLGLLVMEMLATWTYYRYLNAHGRGVPATAFLLVVSILDAGRNALSFFLLLIVSLGLGVVREELTVMTRAKLLAGAHFIFGVMYAISVVEIELETVSLSTLFFFVLPLSFTMSTFLLWIMYGLQGTMQELQARKQTYKYTMFRKLHLILILAVLIIAGFFVLTSLSFSDRYEEDFASNTWERRWWLLDGYLSVLYALVFVAIAYLWRPTGHNRMLAMSSELAQDEDDAEDYDLEAMQRRSQPADAGETNVNHTARGAAQDVVFEIGSDDEDDSGARRTPIPKPSPAPGARSGSESPPGYDVVGHEEGSEGTGLISGASRADKRID